MRAPPTRSRDECGAPCFENNPLRRSGGFDRVEGDAEAELVQAGEHGAYLVVGVGAVEEVVGAEVVVGGVGGEHVPDGDEDAVTDGGGGAFAGVVAAASGDAAELGAEVGVLAAGVG